MSQHTIALKWDYAEHPQSPGEYNRNHRVTVSGPQHITVSAAPDFMGDVNKADPEQLLVSSLASCHMLFFLAIAKVNGFKVASYTDAATAYLESDGNGGMAVTHIILRPRVCFEGGKVPDAKALERIHSSAHSKCFIANSLKAKVTVEAQPIVDQPFVEALT